METDLKIEKEWRGTLQKSLEEEREKVSAVQTDLQKYKHLEKVYRNFTDSVYHSTKVETFRKRLCIYNTEIQTLKEVVYTKKKQRKGSVYHYFETQTIREDGEFYYPFKSTHCVTYCPFIL